MTSTGAARASDRSLELVDRLARLAAEAEPPQLDDLAARRLIDGAVFSSSRAPASRRSWLPLATATLAAAVAIGFVITRWHAPPEGLLHLTLPTGDRLVGADGARFEIRELSPAVRRFQLQAGTMLFDVAHAAPHQRFEVRTAHVVVVATGTVFSVNVQPTGSRVHVYEGTVELLEPEHVVLAAGATWTGGHATSAAEPPALVTEARTVVRERALRADTPSRDIRPDVDVAAIPVAPTTTLPAAASNVQEDHAPTMPSATSVGDERRRSRPDDRPSRPRAAATTTTVGDATYVASGEDGATDAGSAVASASRDVVLTRDELLVRARAELASGAYDAALASVDAAATLGPLDAAGFLTRGDAARGLGRWRAAADAFAAAAAMLAGTDKVAAAYSAAYLHFHDLHDASAALATLDRFAVDAQQSALEERGLGLRVQILMSLGRKDEARRHAERYLTRFARGDLHAYMRSLLGD